MSSHLTVLTILCSISLLLFLLNSTHWPSSSPRQRRLRQIPTIKLEEAWSVHGIHKRYNNATKLCSFPSRAVLQNYAGNVYVIGRWLSQPPLSLFITHLDNFLSPQEKHKKATNSERFCVQGPLSLPLSSLGRFLDISRPSIETTVMGVFYTLISIVSLDNVSTYDAIHCVPGRVR